MSHKPRKRFGQNFLHDRHIIQRIINAIDTNDSTRIVEIGPGKGALTIPLLQATGRLDVVEIDRDLAQQLAASCRAAGTLNIHVMDVLKFDFCGLDAGKIKVVGNLPFNISTPLLFHLLNNIHCIERMLFMMQREVVDRICAQPDSGSYGRLTVMVQSVCEARKLFNIAPGAFTPAPKVEASIVSLIPKSAVNCRVHDRMIFSQVVKQAFNQRRKTIRNSLKGLADETTLREAGIVPSERAENLSVADYIKLANFLHDTHNIPRTNCG
ncbi:MAG: 16S rRNA (adenine(1518)-N(6)/adenine(1519)-N(6))-dimethyltransferase [Gammaproteobacteria bacterium RIFCSPLOWO2_02_FULL_52_10]|nr:MAG: 16S rRNA (adenine(1518)-N(6)/adenine(1519)-N(6))-dimethyltransferase [Gammaproteobacteria bacterium RIFCSPLOWO2_02_FULL_52_10]OGT86868.1 MAG: 16S rRNA (adenine(1518)-N(6)/adenine(1519)-N(6))-dimethyltransferase [Gammaproteobacteria bacterium RIFCSPLOWO2_12_FULL_52_10]